MTTATLNTADPLPGRSWPSGESGAANDQEPDQQHETPGHQRERETADLIVPPPFASSHSSVPTPSASPSVPGSEVTQPTTARPATRTHPARAVTTRAPGRGQQPAPARQLTAGTRGRGDPRWARWPRGTGRSADLSGVRAGRPWPVHARRGRQRSHRADTPEAGKVLLRLCPPELARAYPSRRSTRRMVDDEPGPYRPRRAYPDEPAEPESPRRPPHREPRRPSDPASTRRGRTQAAVPRRGGRHATNRPRPSPAEPTTTRGSGRAPTANRATDPDPQPGPGRAKSGTRPPTRRTRDEDSTTILPRTATGGRGASAARRTTLDDDERSRRASAAGSDC